MANNTEYLHLYEKDPVADGQDFFDIQTMLNDNFDKIDLEVRKYHRVFNSSDWTINNSAADGYKASMTISQNVHSLEPITGVINWRARCLSNGVLYPNTWAAMETIAVYDQTSKAITIKASSAYSGDILITG